MEFQTRLFMQLNAFKHPVIFLVDLDDFTSCVLFSYLYCNLQTAIVRFVIY